MPLVDTAYSSKSINVPPHLPLILKQFCKAAIRTQPYDLLKWSSAYFRALAEGIEPPTKLRLEYPLSGNITGFTLGFLKVLYRQFGDYNKWVPVDLILQRWNDLCLDRQDWNLIMIIGKFQRQCQIKKFLAIAVGLLGASLFDTMLMICELFTLEPNGGSAMIPVTLFIELYGYLASLTCDGSKRDSTEDHPSEFLHDFLESQTPSDHNKNFESKPISSMSQDTDVEIELDHDHSTESTLKDDSTDVEIMKDQRLKLDNQTYSESQVKIDSRNENEGSRNAEEILIFSDDYPENESGKIHSPRTAIKVPSEYVAHFPNIPGIGPRLNSEQVAKVVVWMTECARLQEGMVGPRNLRHVQCPYLDHQESFS